MTTAQDVREIKLPAFKMHVAIHRGIEYVNLSELQSWLYKAALGNEIPAAQQTLRMVADQLGEAE